MKRYAIHPVDNQVTAASNNVLLWRLGQIASKAGNPKRKDVGDPIDRGWILLGLLNKKGFTLMKGTE